MNMRWARHPRKSLFLIGFGGSALLLILAVIADLALSTDVLLLVPHAPATVELNRALFIPGDSVAELYGNPLDEPVRILLPDPDRLIRPEEDSSLLLLPVDKESGENPLQVQTIWFFVKPAVPAAFLLGMIGFMVPKRAAAARERRRKVHHG